MKKSPIIISLVVLLLLIGLGVLAYQANKKPTTTTPTTPTTGQQTMPSTSQPEQSQNQSTPTSQSSSNEVAIQNFAFSPASLTVKKGATVKWTNDDTANHTVTEDDNKSGPNSPVLAQGQSYSFTFTSTGTFSYKCSIHPSMHGVVTVTD